MGIVIRQSIKSTIVSIGGSALGAIIMLASAKIFSQQDYGFTRILLNNTSTISFIAILGFSSSLLIYGQKYNCDHPARSGFLSYTILIPGLFTILLCAALLFFKKPIIDLYFRNETSENLENINRYYVLFPLYIFFNYLWLWAEGYLASINRNALLTFMREILFRLLYIIIIFLFAKHYINFTTFIWSLTLLTIIPISLLFFFASRDSGFRFIGDKELTKEEKKDVFNFSFFHMLSLVGVMVVFQLDSFLLTPFAENGVKAVAIYGFAFFAANLLRTPSRMMGAAIMPTLTKTYNENDIPKLRKLFTISSVNMIATSMIVGLILVVNIDNYQRVMDILKPGYEMVKPLTLILVCGTLTDIIFGPNYELIGVTKYYRYNFWISLLLIIIIFALNAWLIKIIGIAGAAWATSIGLLIYNIFKATFLWIKFKANPFSSKTIIVLITGILIAAILYFIPYFGNLILDIAVRSAIAILLLVISYYVFNVSEEITALIRNVIFNRRLY